MLAHSLKACKIAPFGPSITLLLQARLLSMSSPRPSAAALPPEKRQRQHSPESDGKQQNDVSLDRTNGPKIWRPLNDKEQAKRIKSKARNRQKGVDKQGEEPIFYDICDLLGRAKVEGIIGQGQHAEFQDKFARGEQIECRIERLSSHGDGLAIAPSGDWVIAIPHCLPGELVLARLHSNERLFSRANLVKIVEHAAEGSNNIKRQDELVQCKYFGSCSGCQYQHIDYAQQLEIKRGVVRKAFQHYAELDANLVPEIGPTLPSPEQYNYRTKLTPHFELPHELRRRRGGARKDPSQVQEKLPDVAIGFDKAGAKTILDIEECSIATPAINQALPEERGRVKDKIASYKNGATILIRDSLTDFVAPNEESQSSVITDHKGEVKEQVGPVKFLTPANAFFQNNRSILPSLVSYIEEQVRAHTIDISDRYLVDAYCGSGLFSLCLAHLFTKVSGVEISADSIKFAKRNAELNGITNADFLAGDAQEIFKKIDYPSAQTVTIIDPPRRGCDRPFIEQLLQLAPRLIVYVSCNVHTQARDVGQIVRGSVTDTEAPLGASQYEIVSLRGADLFPQTYHVEGVCILKRRG